MSPRKPEKGVRDKSAERQVGLATLLQSSRFGFSKQDIAQRIPGYGDPQSDAFNRMFERDKVELLAAGIEIEVFQPDPFDQNEFKYRLSKNRNFLPELSFTSEEARYLALATEAWRSSPNQQDARDLRHKLEAIGVDVVAQESRIDVNLSINISDVAKAIKQRRRIKFFYQKPGSDVSEEREVAAWGMAVRKGNLYIYGWDKQRDSQRAFNARRITSEISQVGAAQSYEIPEHEPLMMVTPQDQAAVTIAVELDISNDHGHYWLRLPHEVVSSGKAGVRIKLHLADYPQLIHRLAADAPGVTVVAPAAIRERITAHLEAAAHAF